MNCPVTLPEDLLTRSVAGCDGCDEVAWFRADALEVIAHCLRSSVAVLGGDVLNRIQGRTVPACANWHSEQLPGETWAGYAERSCESARKYISAFPDLSDGSIVYVIVFRGPEQCLE